MKKKEISFQVYTARKFKPYDDIFRFISSVGITNVELFELEPLNQTKALLERYSITALSSHIGFSTLENTKEIIDKLKTLNIKHAIVPCPQPLPGIEFKDNFNKTEEEWNEFGKKLSSYIKIFEDNGLTLGYHNHAFEYNKLPSGKMPIECILDQHESLKFEIDIGWTIAGNENPIYWIKKYSNKIVACHLKDFYSEDVDFQNHGKQSAIGDGFINWNSILFEIKKTDCSIFVLEHDDPQDYKKYILKSLKNLNSIY